jgi:Trypsin
MPWKIEWAKKQRELDPRIAETARGVLQIFACNKNGVVLHCGGGVVIDGDIVLTAKHVLENAQLIIVGIDDGKIRFAPEVDMGDIKNPTPPSELDIAAFPLPRGLKEFVRPCPLSQNETQIVSEKDPKHIPFEKGFFIGFPHLTQESLPTFCAKPIVHEVEISFLEETLVAPWGAGDPHGLSGGAMVNTEGQLVGIVTSEAGADDFVVGVSLKSIQSSGLCG